MDKIPFEDGVKLKNATVTIQEQEYEVAPAKYESPTPFSSFNLNKMQDNIDNAKLEKTIYVSETGTDLNNYKSDGVYYFSSTVTPMNIPTGVNGWLQVFSSNQNSVKQIWYRYGTINSNDYEIYVRTKTATDSWSDWISVFEKDSGWKSITPLIGTPATGYYVPKYRKIGKMVELRGYVSNVTKTGADIFVLPEGFRPSSRLRLYTAGDDINVTQTVRILEDGAVQLFRSNGKSPYIVNFDNVVFFVD